MKDEGSPGALVSMPLLTSNPGAMITTVGGIQSFRIALYVANFIAALQVRTAARQGWWLWETRARKFMSSGSNEAKDGRLVVVPPLFRAFRREFPDLTSRSYIDWPSALTKVLPAQVARAARSAATSQLVRRAQHVRRRGAVKHRP